MTGTGASLSPTVPTLRERILPLSATPMPVAPALSPVADGALVMGRLALHHGAAGDVVASAPLDASQVEL